MMRPDWKVKSEDNQISTDSLFAKRQVSALFTAVQGNVILCDAYGIVDASIVTSLTNGGNRTELEGKECRNIFRDSPPLLLSFS